MNSDSKSVAPKTVEITVAGKAIQAREGETIIHALWQAGQGHAIQTGCVGGVCGACTVTLRFKDGRRGGTDLACLRPVEEGMEVFPFPVDALLLRRRYPIPTEINCVRCFRRSTGARNATTAPSPAR